MKEIFFKCTLLSDVVLNSKLATEGNMTTLDYIPGSNFLGIVAKEFYNDSLEPEKAYSIFHSGEVSFGDAIISDENELNYQLPFDLMMVKGHDKIGEDAVYLQHLLSDLEEDKVPKDDKGFKAQLKQKRSGYVSSSGKVISKIKKTFALKSAQDTNERRSKEGAMFGFESLKKGQEFIFSIKFENKKFVEDVIKALVGRRRIGKSKTAEFGQVDIQQIDSPQKIETFQDAVCTLVYAQSNLCFFDKTFGQSTFQPTAEQLGMKGEICWKKSQIRTYSYSPWNGKRNTTDTQRNCIAAGSVFYIEGANEPGEKSVGEYQSEGLGRIIINPVFLNGEKETGLSNFFPIKKNVTDENSQNLIMPEIAEHFDTALGNLLKRKYDQKKAELELSAAIQIEFENAIKEPENSNSKKKFYKVSSSQWGAIRNYAIREADINILKRKLLSKEEGYLTHGVAYKRIWSKRNETPLNELKSVFDVAVKSSKPTVFIAKFAAEMAKYVQGKEKTNSKKEVHYAN